MTVRYVRKENEKVVLMDWMWNEKSLVGGEQILFCAHFSTWLLNSPNNKKKVKFVFRDGKVICYPNFFPP